MTSARWRRTQVPATPYVPHLTPWLCCAHHRSARARAQRANVRAWVSFCAWLVCCVCVGRPTKALPLRTRGRPMQSRVALFTPAPPPTSRHAALLHRSFLPPVRAYGAHTGPSAAAALSDPRKERAEPQRRTGLGRARASRERARASRERARASAHRQQQAASSTAEETNTQQYRTPHVTRMVVTAKCV